MVKYATRRSYKNRASKKRRTIRKLKRTMRRKIQRGGNGSAAVLAPVIMLFTALFVGNPKVMNSLNFLAPLLSDDSQAGGNKRLNQMGGEGKIDEALNGLSDTIKNDNISGLTVVERNNLLMCVGTLKDKGGISAAEFSQMEGQKGGFSFRKMRDDTAAALSIENDNGGWLGKAAAALNDKGAAAAAGVIDRVKDMSPEGFKQQITTEFETVKSNILAKVSNMKDKGKQVCMRLILSYGIDLIKAKLSSSISMENIKKVMADKATAVKDKSTQLLNLGTGLLDSLRGNSSSSKPATGADNEHIIEIVKIKSVIDNKTDEVASEKNFKAFEDKLRAKLREKGWPDDETEFKVGISRYNTPKIDSDPRITRMTRTDNEIFIFALFSGMITSVVFDESPSIGLSGKDAFFARYTGSDPYVNFKSELFDILSRKGRHIRTIKVKITTDFSKIPDYLPIKKEVLKSRNRETVGYYISVKKQLADSTKKKNQLQSQSQKAQNEQNAYALQRIQEALQTATDNSEKAFNEAVTAYQAALAAEIPESELIHPQSD
jgi:hypothetical protein